VAAVPSPAVPHGRGPRHDRIRRPYPVYTTRLAVLAGQRGSHQPHELLSTQFVPCQCATVPALAENKEKGVRHLPRSGTTLNSDGEWHIAVGPSCLYRDCLKLPGTKVWLTQRSSPRCQLAGSGSIPWNEENDSRRSSLLKYPVVRIYHLHCDSSAREGLVCPFEMRTTALLPLPADDARQTTNDESWNPKKHPEIPVHKIKCIAPITLLPDASRTRGSVNAQSNELMARQAQSGIVPSSRSSAFSSWPLSAVNSYSEGLDLALSCETGEIRAGLAAGFLEARNCCVVQ
jgi:hypothetical protein